MKRPGQSGFPAAHRTGVERAGHGIDGFADELGIPGSHFSH
jgi:hypothetical protein